MMVLTYSAAVTDSGKQITRGFYIDTSVTTYYLFNTLLKLLFLNRPFPQKLV